MNDKLKSLTPANIDELTVREVLDLIPDAQDLPSVLKRYKIIRMIYEILGFSLSNDALLALLYETGPQLCLATAGGGKTTFAQIKIILEKIWRKSKCYEDGLLQGENILCLVYNRHNIDQMNRKQKQLIEKVNLATTDSINLDDKINSCTMHSFCERWRKTYASKMGILGFSLLSEYSSEILFKNAMAAVKPKFPDVKTEKVNIQSLKTLYTYKTETLSSFEDLKNTDKFYDIGLSIDYIESLFGVYDRFKQLRRKYDFTDMLFHFYELIRDDVDVRRNIQSYYGYIVADEVQDFTPIMWEILKLLVDDGTPLLCIGDEDQNIYSFRGADIFNTLNFSDQFGGDIFLLSRNRRCRSNILDVGKSVISKNTMRFNKDLKCVKDGGKVEYIPYTNMKGQYLKLIRMLEKMSIGELEESVVCYRERETSAELIELLADKGIPFHVLSGYFPYTHELYNHVFQVMDILECPMDPQCHLNLFKVLPASKNDIYDKLQYNPSTHQFERNDNVKHFSKIEWGGLLTVNKFPEILQELTEISKKVKTAPMSEYFPRIFHLLKTYYWNFKKSANNTADQSKINSSNRGSDFDNVFEARIFDMFNVDMTYKEFYTKFENKKKTVERNSTNQVGLAIATFHGLKGLEYDNVFAINLDNRIFPNFALIESKDYPEEIELELKESERRLFYVAVTRARDNLYMFYKEDNASVFVKELLSGISPEIAAKAHENSKMLLDVMGMDLFDDFDDIPDIDECLTDLESSTINVTAQMNCDEYRIEEYSEAVAQLDNLDLEEIKIADEKPEPTFVLGDRLQEVMHSSDATISDIKNQVGTKIRKNNQFKFSRGEDISSRLNRFKNYGGA